MDEARSEFDLFPMHNDYVWHTMIAYSLLTNGRLLYTTSDYFHLPYQNTRFVTAVCQLQVSFMTNFCGWSFNIVQVLKLDPQKLVMKPTCNRHTAVTKTSILAKNTPKTRQNAGV